MDLRDRDLISIQEARDLVARAATAQREFARFSQSQVDAVVEACANAATDAAEALARRAVEETGFGNIPDKTMKNRFASVDLLRAIREMPTVGILREDRDRGIIEIASPVGVVAAVIPSTNPTSTAIYKSLISLKACNAIVLSPHPAAIGAICETAGVLSRAALSAGAPEGLIGCMRRATLAGTQELMQHHDTGVILATGGIGLVRAAYRSGKPAYGVGPGNVPSFLERTADVRKAIADIFAGKTFDYGTICSSEQSIVVQEAVREPALEECRRQGAHLLSAEEAQKVSALVWFPGTHTPNTKIVGQPATVIAAMAGVRVPPATRVLVACLEPEQVGPAFPLSAEKLSPILAFYAVANLTAGIDLCTRLLRFGGLGHTCSIHSHNDAAVRQFGQAVPAFRVCVNTSAVHGSIGYSTNLFPAMTLGCGAPGGNITSDNIGPQHLMNLKRIAWESRPVQHRTVPSSERLAGTIRAEADAPRAFAVAAGAANAVTPTTALPDPIAAVEPAPVAPPIPTPSAANPAVDPGANANRVRIAEVVERVLAERGIARGNSSKVTTPSPATSSVSSTTPLPSEIASEIAGRLFSPGPALKSANNVTPLAAGPPPPVEFLQPAPAPPVQIWPFVSENDVRQALFRSEKIHIGPKTILTPSARDLGLAHEVFVETKT